MWFRTIAEGVAQLTADGVDQDSATQRALEASERALDEMAPRLAAQLIRETPAEARRHRREHNGFQGRLRNYWGHSLDLMLSMIHDYEDLGARFNEEKNRLEPHPRPVTLDALTSTHARACRTALEVYHLLSAGLSSGALARCRTLHELAVTATVLNNYGRHPEHADLAERFILHAEAVKYSEATTYEEHVESLGHEPLDQEDLDAALAARDELRERFGSKFDSENGWAIGIDGGTGQVNFRELEKLSGIDHLRPYYRYTSHQVHADSRGAAFTTVSQGGRTVKLSGYSNAHLTDPAQLALISLHQVTTATVLSGDYPAPGDVLTLQALSIMLDETLAELARAQDSIDAAEARVLARLDHPAPLARTQDAAERLRRRFCRHRHAGETPES